MKNLQVYTSEALRDKCRNTEFFWFVFSGIWTEYGEIRSISLYSVRMRKNTDHKKLRIWTLFAQLGVCTSTYNVRMESRVVEFLGESCSLEKMR